MLFVSHNMAAAGTLCTEGLLLERGKLLFSGKIDDAIQQYHLTRDHSGSNEWIRPLEKSRGALSFKRIAIELLGDQPKLVLRIVCSFEGKSFP